MPAAQIAAVFRIYATAVRSIYLLTVICALAVGVWAFLNFSVALDVQQLIVIGFLLAYAGPAIRAAIRLARSREFVPDAHLRERPLVATLVSIAAAVGIMLLYFVIRVWIDIQPWGRDDVGGPLAGIFALAVLLHVFALLTGEIVLVGRAHPLRSVPVS